MNPGSAGSEPVTEQPRRGWWGFRPADETWEENLTQVVVFRKDNGHWPRASRTVESEERRLGRWLSNQRQDSRNLLLSGQRQLRLDETLPGWLSSRGSVPDQPTEVEQTG